ncbi:replication factor A protein 1-like [Solanum pennellii]|uniref:Replication factor A protein 1-like n=1 Tax=Solanum pennellii TaxID=28526 RepID=A0ABM1GST6_SOLPN|nr:replication factor A protein 1-like [Solanum pennellii]
MAYSLLSDLDATRDDWLIRVRVCRLWEMINHKRSPDMISLDMILIDKKGTLMHAIILMNQVNKFRDKLKEGSADDIVHIPQNGFQFIQPEIIRSRINNNILLYDVVGCLCGIGDIESVGSKWQKRDIHILTDLEDLTIKSRITLWEDHGESFYSYVYPNDSGPYIVIFTATTVKEFRGELTFSTTAASKIYVNLKMDNVTALLHKFSKKSADVVTIASGNSSNVSSAQAMFENRMTIVELLDSEWTPDIEECVVTLFALITAIENFFDWYYISCNLCNKKVESSNGVYTCQKCNKQCDLQLIRMVFTVQGKVILEDLTEQTDFNAKGSNTDYSKELSDERDASISKQRVYSRKLKKRRNLFIADTETSDDANFQGDVIVENRKNGLQRITDLHPSFMSMTYPLIHPYGEDGYRLGIQLVSQSQKNYTREHMTMRQYYGYRIQQRLKEGHTLIQAGKLLQQYIVDGYMAIEEE